MKLEEMTLDVEQHVEVKGDIGDVFKGVLHRFGEGSTNPNGESMQMILEQWPGGRWFRDLGDPQTDAALAKALRRLRSVALMADFSDSSIRHLNLPAPGVDTLGPSLPAEPFLSAANTNWGVGRANQDADLTVRRHWPFPAPESLPSLPWTAALLAHANLFSEPQKQWIRYYGRDGAWDTISYCYALDQKTNYFHDKIVYHINPTGRFVIGGPMGDAGLTGRKIIVDTYGGMARHGGGAFSGKDPSKVDRSAAYAARWVAKHVVASGAATRCEVQVAYAIGVAQPVSVLVETFGTATVDPECIEPAVREVFDLRPAAIINELNLRQPIYRKTAAYGHFGRDEPGFTWEQLGNLQSFKAAVGV
jgi:hypothetical protein